MLLSGKLQEISIGAPQSSSLRMIAIGSFTIQKVSLDKVGIFPLWRQTHCNNVAKGHFCTNLIVFCQTTLVESSLGLITPLTV